MQKKSTSSPGHRGEKGGSLRERKEKKNDPIRPYYGRKSTSVLNCYISKKNNSASRAFEDASDFDHEPEEEGGKNPFQLKKKRRGGE